MSVIFWSLVSEQLDLFDQCMCVRALLIFPIESITDSQQHFVWKDVCFLFFIFMNVKMCLLGFVEPSFV